MPEAQSDGETYITFAAALEHARLLQAADWDVTYVQHSRLAYFGFCANRPDHANEKLFLNYRPYGKKVETISYHCGGSNLTSEDVALARPVWAEHKEHVPYLRASRLTGQLMCFCHAEATWKADPGAHVSIPSFQFSLKVGYPVDSLAHAMRRVYDDLQAFPPSPALVFEQDMAKCGYKPRFACPAPKVLV